MEFAGTSSWRLEMRDSELLHIALYIRDVARIQVPVDPSVPPSLRNVADGVAPDPHVDRARLGLAMVGLVAARSWHSKPRPLRTVRAAQMSYVPAQDWMRQLADAQAAAFDPPEFASLAGSPAMRDIATLRFREAHDWFSRRSAPPRHSRPEMPAISHSVIERAAVGVAAERRVGFDRLDAAVDVLDVSGSWSHLAAPGYVLCSADVARDDNSAEVVVRIAFLSGLDGPPRP